MDRTSGSNMEHEASPTPAAAAASSKPVVKRTSVAPWNAAIMGSKISSSPLGPSASSSPGAGRHQQDPKPARIVSDIALPSMETAQGKTNGLSGSARIMALQQEWEKGLAKPAGGEATSVSTRESSSSSDSSIEVVGTRPAVRQMATGPPAPSVNSSPVPLPDYALAHKRRSSEMNGAQETPHNKRQQTSATSVESDKGQRKAPMIAQAYRLTEAAAMEQYSSSQNPYGFPEGFNPPPRKPLPGTSAKHPQAPPAVNPQQPPPPNPQAGGSGNSPKVLPPSIAASSQRSMNEPLEVNGKMMNVIDQGPNGNYYYSYYEPDGTRHSGMGALFPTNYKILDTDESRFVCPVRDCRKRTDNLRGLAGHFSSSHSSAAYNDNLDGTLSKLGAYKGSSKHASALVVSHDPLPPNAPPPAEPSLSWASQLRNQRRSLPRSELAVKETRPREPRHSMPAVVTSAVRSSPSSTKSDDSAPLTYLNGFLSAKQKVPKRDDIKHMSKLPRLRSLPDVWLHHHHGEELDVHHYACALAYLVGEEVTGPDQCRQVDSNKLKSTCRLSDRCIRVPSKMPISYKVQFSRVWTCVGCRYWSHLQRQINPCHWNPERREPGAKPPHPRGNKVRQEDEREVQDSEAEKSSTESAKAEPSQPDTETDPEPRPLGNRQLRQRKEVKSATSSGEPVVQARKLDDSTPKLEDWEFAPGKVLDETESETIAFSTSYLTSAQPITIADDISFNRLRIPPGGTQHWPAEDGKLRYCEVISGKVDLRLGGQTCAVGQGGVFTMRPGMACSAENRRYVEAVLSCHTIDNYSLI